MLRLLALSEFSRSLASLPYDERGHPPRWLAAYICHRIKSLVSRPDDASWFRKLNTFLGIERSVSLYNAPLTNKIDVVQLRVNLERSRLKLDEKLRLETNYFS
ncbi:uncharacterized protein VTP21DRAFT_10823 [Calcarisporiella thermophila]|uniref:uncharacterized protein n=1 Tax=Calcarisporiella thermophila TaxID=911321 RepID=UPI0037420B7D